MKFIKRTPTPKIKTRRQIFFALLPAWLLNDRKAPVWSRSSMLYYLRLSLMVCVAAIIASTHAKAASCTVESEPLAFGLYDASSSSPTQTTTTINVSCDQKTSFTIKLSDGMHSGNSFFPRIMKTQFTGYALNYNLYLDSSLTRIWGDGASGTFIFSLNGPIKNGSFTVYGAIPPRQRAAAGVYEDLVNVMVEW